MYVFIVTQKFTVHKFPIEHIAAVPITLLIGGEQKVIAFEIDNHRISSGAVFSLLRKPFERRITVFDIDGITVGFLLRRSSDER